MKTHRLQPLCWLPPPTGTPWTAAPAEVTRCHIRRLTGDPLSLALPLFWYEPSWYHTPPPVADMVATSVATLGVVVTALRSELAEWDEPLTLYRLTTRTAAGQSQPRRNASADSDGPLPRMVPYRPERYGLSVQDFDEASIIDVRLTPSRDPSGRYAFGPQQLQRWEATQDDEFAEEDSELTGKDLHPGWAPSAALPPDVPALDQLSAKLDQLRELASTAALMVSITPHRMVAEIPKLVAMQPDGLILQLDELPLTGLELGQVTRAARRLLTAAGAAALPLWLVPGEVSPDDAVKLLALGASGVAIDHWCAGLIERAEQVIETSPAARLQHGLQRELVQPLVREAIEESLLPSLDRFRGLAHRWQSLPANERLGSLDRQWAKAFEVPWISAGRHVISKPDPSPVADS